MKYISLFSGIGGFDLGFDRAGMECVLQVEKDEKARAVLAHHWPSVPRMELVEDVTRDKVRELGIETVDLICGGFPCQDVSSQGLRAGIKKGTRSGLWSEFSRIIGEIHPRWAVIENVRNLLSIDAGGGASQQFLETWPKMGMMQNGLVYQLPDLAQITKDTGSSLWPTPRASMSSRPSSVELKNRIKGIANQVDRLEVEVFFQSCPQLTPGYHVNPNWTEWLMGFPIQWTDLSNVEMP